MLIVGVKTRKDNFASLFLLYYQIDTSYISWMILPIKMKRPRQRAMFNGIALVPMVNFYLAGSLSASRVLSSLLKKLDMLTLYQIIGHFG